MPTTVLVSKTCGCLLPAQNDPPGGEDGALVIDLQNFQHFSMDTDTWFATFGSGTLLGDLTDRLYENGHRVIAHGTCPQVRRIHSTVSLLS